MQGLQVLLHFHNNLSRRIKRNEIETMETVRENRKWSVRPPSEWNCHQRNHWRALYQSRRVGEKKKFLLLIHVFDNWLISFFFVSIVSNLTFCSISVFFSILCKSLEWGCSTLFCRVLSGTSVRVSRMSSKGNEKSRFPAGIVGFAITFFSLYWILKVH